MRGWLLRQGVLFFSWDPEYGELQSAVMASLMGLWLINPWWSVYASAPSYYRAMSQVMPETAWGALLFGVGTIQFACLYETTRRLADPVRWWYAYRWRRRMALVMVALWLFCAAGLAVGDYRALGECTFVTQAILSVATYVRLMWVRFRERERTTDTSPPTDGPDS